MTRKIEIQINEHKIVAELLNTKTAESILKQLPFKSKAQTWGGVSDAARRRLRDDGPVV